MSEPSSPGAGARQAGQFAQPTTPSAPQVSWVATPPAIPDHELLRRIGGGSYGEVWLARNVLGTYRAVKIVYRNRFENDRPFEREFEGIQKFEPISRSHPSQVDILQVGRGEGYFFYVMELADDANAEIPDLKFGIKQEDTEATEIRASSSSQLSPFPPVQTDWQSYAPRTLKSELQRRGRLPFDECLRVALGLTTALKHLHQHGLIHRDIKPSNIIFVHGVPKLADIGLVTDVDATMSFVGTEGFLAPEGRGSVQADLYSLGKVFYEMATGKDRLDFPEPSTLLGEMPDRAALVELNEIILKACAADPRRRYQTAEQVRSDLVWLQAGRSLQRRRRVERMLALAARVGVAATMVALVAIGFSWQSKRARRQALEQTANQKPKQPQTSLGVAADNAVTIRKLPLQAELIYSVSRDGRYVAYKPIGESYIGIFETLTSKTNAAAAFKESPYEGAVSFSPDGRQIAYDTGMSAAFVANIDGSGAKQLYTVKGDGSGGFWVPGWSGNGRELVIHTWDEKGQGFSTLDVKSGEKKDLNFRLSPGDRRGGWILSGSGRYLAYHTGPGPAWKRKLGLIDLVSGSDTTLVEKEVVDTFGWSPNDAKFLFASDRSGKLDLWAVAVRDGRPSGEPELIKANAGDISLVGIARDGKLYYREEQTEACSVYVASVDFQTGEVSSPPRRVTERFAGLQTYPTWSNDGEKLMLWIRANQRVIQRFAIVSLVSSEVSEFAVDDFGQSWGSRTPNKYLRYSWSENGGFLLVQGNYTGTNQQGIHRYDLASGKVETVIRMRDTSDDDWNCHPKAAPDGNSFYYVRRKFYERKPSKLEFDYDDRIVRRDLRSGSETIVYQGPEKLQIWCPIGLSPDGEHLAIATYGETTLADFKKEEWIANIVIVDLSRGTSRELIRFARPEYPHWLDWSPNGECLVFIKSRIDQVENFDFETSAGQNEIWAIHLNSGKTVRLQLPFPKIWHLAVHPDGRQLAFFATTESGSSVDLWVMEGLMPALMDQKETAARKN